MSSVLNLFALINPFFSIAMELAPYKSSIYWTVLQYFYNYFSC